jgi:hypothetical protein
MIRVKFQNGADAPEIFLDQEFETKEEAKKRLDHYVSIYGTHPDAIAWLEGDPKPKKLAKAEKELADAAAEDAAAEAGAPVAETLVAPDK